MTTEAERLYAEAAQERLEATLILEENNERVLVNNTGGIGIVIKYLVLKRDNDALVELVRVDSEEGLVLGAGDSGSIDIPDAWLPLPERYEILIVTERGSVFRAELPASQVFLSITLRDNALRISPGSSGSTELTIKASKDYPRWEVKLTADPGNCTAEYSFTGVSCGSCSYFMGLLICSNCVTETDIPYQRNFISKVEVSESLLVPEPGSELPPITITVHVSSDAEPGSSCYIWFRALNASNGAELAGAGLQIVVE